MPKPRVYILKGDSYSSACKMFENHGFELAKLVYDCDLICFLGGTDVDPAIYGKARNPNTQNPDVVRDETEVAIFKSFKDIPKVGICRGGQLLNVLSGGMMIQHLGETRSGDVLAEEHDLIGTGKYRTVRVDHHQGMLNPDEDIACDQFLRAKDHHYDGKTTWVVSYASYYPDTQSLCFQPHPEWGHKGTEDYFFELLEQCFDLSGQKG